MIRNVYLGADIQRPIVATNAQQVDYHYLQLLLQDLRQEGTPYKAVVVQNEMDLESPAFLGNPAHGTVSQGRDIGSRCAT